MNNAEYMEIWTQFACAALSGVLAGKDDYGHAINVHDTSGRVLHRWNKKDEQVEPWVTAALVADEMVDEYTSRQNRSCS